MFHNQITSVAIVVEGCDFYGFLCQLWWILWWGPTWVVFISSERSHALLPTLSRTERRLAGCPCFGPLAINFPTWLRTVIDGSLSTSQAKICAFFHVNFNRYLRNVAWKITLSAGLFSCLACLSPVIIIVFIILQWSCLKILPVCVTEQRNNLGRQIFRAVSSWSTKIFATRTSNIAIEYQMT